MGRAGVGADMIPFINIYSTSINDYDFRLVSMIIAEKPKKPTREQARTLLEQPVSTNGLTIYRDEETNE